MKKYRFLCLSASLLILSSLASAERYFVTAKEGLFIRSEPSLASKKLGKLPYGYSFYVKDKTVANNWLKISYDNYPYVVTFKEKQSGHYAPTGYVHRDYLTSLDEQNYSLKQISKTKFNRLLKKSKSKKKAYKAIQDQKVISQLLKGKATFKLSEIDYELTRLKTDDGFTHDMNMSTIDTGIRAFYPELNLLLFEAGHSSDMSINTRTGELTETTGNPKYIIESPSGLYRLNGYFGGQECITYFLQKKGNEHYSFFSAVDPQFTHDESSVCRFSQFEWLTDLTFIYAINEFHPNQTYYFGEIKPE